MTKSKEDNLKFVTCYAISFITLIFSIPKYVNLAN